MYVINSLLEPSTQSFGDRMPRAIFPVAVGAVTTVSHNVISTLPVGYRGASQLRLLPGATSRALPSFSRIWPTQTIPKPDREAA
jgi:hypothetical protein